MSKYDAPYGTYRSFRKIDLYMRTHANAEFEYCGSTTWARSCKEAVARLADSRVCDPSNIRAVFNDTPRKLPKGVAP